MNVSRFFLSWQSFNHFAARAWFMGFARTSSLLAEIYFPKKSQMAICLGFPFCPMSVAQPNDHSIEALL
jgi:hypothetical protein